ncbi:MAG: formate--tetrahydrofolate ligase, partial [Eubacterium sp.]|nr:formate--tetrahydrofolate ligase [Eubacterium sp.]
GGEGSKDLAQKVVDACDKENDFHQLYDLDMPLYDKIETIAREIYGADGVDYTKEAKKSIDEFIALGADKIPVCMAKTQYSLSDNPSALGRPKNFRITVSSASLSNGAGFIVCQTGSIMTMPGLSKQPAAYGIDIDENGNTVGLF